MRRIFHGGEPLHRAGVGQTERADVSIAPRLPCDPFDGVETVAALVLIRDEVAIGGVASAHVLHDDGITARDGFLERFVVLQRKVLPVRRAIDQRRKLAFRARKQNVSTKHHAIAHRHAYIGSAHGFRTLARRGARIEYRRAGQSDEQREKRRALNGGGIARAESEFHWRTILLEPDAARGAGWVKATR